MGTLARVRIATALHALAAVGLKCWADKAYQAPADTPESPSGAAGSSAGSDGTTAATPRSAASASRPWPC